MAGPTALALSILEELDFARNESAAVGLSTTDVALCLEQVGRAMLAQR